MTLLTEQRADRKAQRRITQAAYEAEMSVIVRMHTIQRKSPAEISEATGVSVAKIKDRLNRAGYRLARAPAVHNQPLGSGEDHSIPTAERDDALVALLVARGGYPRLSEKLTRLGHVACLPLVAFEARP